MDEFVPFESREASRPGLPMPKGGVREPVPGDRSMLEETHKHRKAAAGTAEWNVRVPPEGSATLKHRVLVRY